MNRSNLPLGVCLAAICGLAAATNAQTGFSISGSMSNFDCSNRCDYPCDEMEIQIEGAQPEDIIHTYTNGNYGTPTVTLAADGLSTIVDYRNPGHLTNVGSVEHFGITLRGAVYYGPPAVYHPTHVHWYRDGHIATVNGQIPTADGGSTHATQPMLPSVTAALNPGVLGPHSAGNATMTVTNNDLSQPIWIKRRAQVTAAQVTLEALMPNNPVVTTSIVIDASPLKLNPGQSVTAANDLLEIEEAQSVVFSAEYYQDVIGSDPFTPDGPGPLLGNVMTAAIASPQDLGCPHGPPTITQQPESVTQDANTRVDLHVNGHGDDLSPLTYIWLFNGMDLTNGNGISGSTSSHLRINSLTSATEGFYSVRITNVCDTILSQSALVFITGHNVAPLHAVCRADFNGLGGVNVQDIFDFLSAWFGGDSRANINGGGLAVSDIFDYLNTWFVGC